MEQTYASESTHWYDEDGNPQHTYTTKKGEIKPTTLREAKKYGYWPSVSEIIKVRAAHDLTNWLQNRVAYTCFDNPPKPGESRDEYCQRIRLLDRTQRAIAPDTGSAIHTCIEKILAKKELNQDDQAYHSHAVAALDCLGGWCGLDELLPERSFYHPLGYGGRCDIHKWPSGPFKHVGFVGDFKSKDFDESWEPAIYWNHTMQLAAYRQGFGMPAAQCAIIFVSTKIPGLVRLVKADQGTLDRSWLVFCKLLEIWQIEKDHKPENEDG